MIEKQKPPLVYSAEQVIEHGDLMTLVDFKRRVRDKGITLDDGTFEALEWDIMSDHYTKLFGEDWHRVFSDPRVTHVLWIGK